ncbi:hypothetical protein Tco_1236276 [Tanacetum coccineum]
MRILVGKMAVAEIFTGEDGGCQNTCRRRWWLVELNKDDNVASILDMVVASVSIRNKTLFDQTPLQRDSGYDGRSEITAYCGNMNFLYEWNLLWRIALRLWLDGGHDRSWWRGFFLDS